MKTVAAVMTLTLFTGLNTASALDAHFVELTCAVKDNSALAARNVYYNFQQNPHFVPMYRSVYSLHQAADRVHRLALQGVAPCRMRAEVELLCTQFQNSKALIGKATGCHQPFTCRVQARRYNFNLNQLRATMTQIGDDIHHLEDDLNPNAGGGILPPPPGSGLPLPPQGVGQPGIGPSLPGQPGLQPGLRTGRNIPLIRRNGRVMLSLSLGR